MWSVDAGGHRYQRWWGEDHLGENRVRIHGHSTGGEWWDDTIGMDTYYNPIPHFGYKLALDHSPTLKRVPLRPKNYKPTPAGGEGGGEGGGGAAAGGGGGGDDGDDPFGPGLDAL